MKYKLVITALILIILIPVSSVSLTTNQDSKLNSKAKWTVMYYMCCDADMMGTYANYLLENLSNIKSTSNLNIVALCDTIKDGDSRLIYINEIGEEIILNQQFGWPDEIDTSNTVTLELFCKQMMESFPAENYAFITFASGGTGWQRYCIHDKSNGKGGPSLPDFALSLKNITNDGQEKIDVLYVSCAMGVIELAYEIKSYVNYIIGTQDCFDEGDFIDRFYELTWDLKNNTDLNAEEFAKKSPENLEAEPFIYNQVWYHKLPLLHWILNNSRNPKLHTVIHYPSSSVINLSRIQNLVNDANDLASYLILYLTNKDFKNQIKNIRQEVQGFGKCYSKFSRLNLIYANYIPIEALAYDGFVDLYHLAQIIFEKVEIEKIKELCEDVMDEINVTIIDIKHTSSKNDNSHGLSIYFPKEKWQYNKFVLKTKLPRPYEDLKFAKNTNWDEFLKKFHDIN